MAKDLARKERRGRNRKVDLRTGKLFPPPSGAKNQPLQGPDGRFLKGNRSGYQPGESGNPGGLVRGIERVYRSRLLRRLTNAQCRKLNLPLGSFVAEGVAARMIDIALTGDERSAIAAAVEIRKATEGNHLRHFDETWRLELEELGIDPDEAYAKIEALIAELAEEAARGKGHEGTRLSTET